MKATAVGLGTALAGCTGGGGDGGDGGGGDGGDGGGGDGGGGDGGDGGDGGGTTDSGGGDGLSGVSMEYWDVINVQSQPSSERIRKFISDFESDTGVTVNVNYSGYEQMSGQEWVQAWQNEAYPVAWNGEDFYFGRIFPTGHIKPFDDYKDRLNDDAIDGMDWAMDLKRDAYRFWDLEGESGILNFPHGAGIRNQLNVRTDLLEQAGYSLDDIPRENDAVANWEGIMEIAQDVQENSDAQWGFYAHGSTFDYNDNTSPWMSSESPGQSRYIAEDGSEAYPGEGESQIWSRWLTRMRDLQAEPTGSWGVSGPETPTISDEEVAQQMVAGQVAMSNVEPLNYPTFVRRMPDLLEQGDFKMVPYPRGNDPDSSAVHVGFHDSGINKAPSSADQQRWDRKVEAALALKNRLLSEDFQSDYMDIIGWLGSNQNQWENTNPEYAEQSRIKETFSTELPDADITWPYHRYSNSIMFTEIGPPVQEALAGNTSPEDAMATVRETGNQLCQDAIDEFGEVGTWTI